MKTLNLELDIAEEDHVAAQNLYQAMSPMVKYGALFFALLAPVIVFFMFRLDAESSMKGIACGLFGAWFGLLWLYLYYLPKQAKKQFAQLKKLGCKARYTIDQDGFELESENGRVRQKLENLHAWKSNDRVLLVYLSDWQFMILPRRFFASDDDYQWLQESLSTHLGKMK
ncbi:YcxB family protein [Persicirhabdus sediminis]|uniref:YcxB family protein n=1 Tax=Persicirhabdus sediminis TaxID=454144 RepID=A0A8J7MC18_9BACT|nr:YcxB family protein [Persicirhabdus sediminis]MBK1790236.1 YcxB family protein [Persicirhabdus sediminis]